MPQSDEYTVGWICAITTEYVAAQAFLDEKHESLESQPRNDNNDYTLGRMGRHNIVITIMPHREYGTNRAGSVATDMMRSFPNIRIGLMVGIGGGAPSPKNDIRLGDIIVNAPCEGKASVLQYDFGKTIQGRTFLRTGIMNQSPLILRAAVSGLITQYELDGHTLKENVDEVLQKRPRLKSKYGRPDQTTDRLYKSNVVHPEGKDTNCETDCGLEPSKFVIRTERTRDEDNPMVHYGIIASGNQLIKDAYVRDTLSEEDDVLCFEMEAAGVINHFPCLVIRGICDYADSHKNKQWQGYASMVAASYAKDVLHRIPPGKVLEEKRVAAALSVLTNVIEEQRYIAREQLQVLKKESNERLSEEEQQCHQLFRLMSGKGNATYEWYKDRIQDRVEDTCMWLVNNLQFQTWMNRGSGPLLISADPGCGKSVLAKYLVDHGLPRSSTICYFFFKDQDQSSIQQALCALLHQLFCQQPFLITHAVPRYRQEGQKLIDSPSSLWDILRKATSDYPAGQVIIVLDALDECAKSDFQSLIHNIADHYRSDPRQKLKYLLTCRPYAQILSTFDQALCAFPSIHIPGEEQSDIIVQEVNRVVRHRLGQLVIKKHLSPEIGSFLEKRLGETPNRTYLWVSLVFDYLMREDFKKTIKGVQLATATLPTTTYEAYENILSKSANNTIVRKVLCILLAAKRPLSVSEMNVAVNVECGLRSTDDLDLENDKDFTQKLRSWCGGFVSIHQDHVYFLHQTAREFLLSTSASSTPIPSNAYWHRSISIDDAHAVLAEICVLYLHSLESEPCSLQDTESTNNQSVNKRAFLHYSAQTWGFHFSSASITHGNPIIPFAVRISDPNSRWYSTWFDIFWNTTRFQKTNLCTALVVASYFGHESIVQLLLDEGANIEACDTQFSMTPLMWAVVKEHEPVVRVLLKHGADVSVRVKHDQTPLLQAAEQGHEGIATLLLENGADTGIRDEQGLTPLMVASENGHKGVIKLLLERGNDINISNPQRDTPLTLAVRGGFWDVVEMLKEQGANCEDLERAEQKVKAMRAKITQDCVSTEKNRNKTFATFKSRFKIKASDRT